MEPTWQECVKKVLTVIAMILLYIIKGIFWLLGFISGKVVCLSESGLKRLDD